MTVLKHMVDSLKRDPVNRNKNISKIAIRIFCFLFGYISVPIMDLLFFIELCRLYNVIFLSDNQPLFLLD